MDLRHALLFSLALTVGGCASSPLKRLEESMDPLVGTKKMAEVDRIIGQPVKCDTTPVSTRCEYRTLIGRNEPAPSAHKPEPAMGPDLSPYEFFDVVEVFYDQTGMMKDWHALSVKAR